MVSEHMWFRWYLFLCVCSKDKTKIASRERERERDDLVRWEKDTKKEEKKYTDQKHGENAILLLNIKVRGHATFLITSLSFWTHSVYVHYIESISLLNPGLKLKGLYLCLASVLTIKV